MPDFDAKHRPHLEALLEPGEALEGVCACSQQKGPFSGGVVALGVTDRRLIVQPLDRRGDPGGRGSRSLLTISRRPRRRARAAAGPRSARR